jgi:hypothetical protein
MFVSEENYIWVDSECNTAAYKVLKYSKVVVLKIFKLILAYGSSIHPMWMIVYSDHWPIIGIDKLIEEVMELFKDQWS